MNLGENELVRKFDCAISNQIRAWLVTAACIYLLTWIWSIVWWAFDLQVSGQLTFVLYVPFFYTTIFLIPILFLRSLYLRYTGQIPADDFKQLAKFHLYIFAGGFLFPYLATVLFG